MSRYVTVTLRSFCFQVESAPAFPPLVRTVINNNKNRTFFVNSSSKHAPAQMTSIVFQTRNPR